MKHQSDTKTIDLLSPGMPGRRAGRPALENALTPTERKRLSRAARAETHGMLSLELPLDLLKQFRECVQSQVQSRQITQNEVVEHWMRGYLKRKGWPG